MPQELLPFIAPGTTAINGLLSVSNNDDRWTYFHASLPVFSHDATERKMFRMITAQFICNGVCRQIDIINTFGVSKQSVIRSVKKYETGGAESFFEKRQGRRGGTVLTDEVLKKAQKQLDQGYARKEVAAELNVADDTLRKAISSGRLHQSSGGDSTQYSPMNTSTQSERDQIDAQAAQAMGTACTRVPERVMAAIGLESSGASSQFESCFDVPNGGVLCALPALLANGLLKGADKLLGSIAGFYTHTHVLLLLAFMALSRIKTIEQLKSHSPGEFGKLLGLDRVPEVRCLRKKLDDLCQGDAASQWSASLSKQWLSRDDSSVVGSLYIDGHVRVYHGNATKLPRRFVSRERLCLRGTTDYWVNDALGRPFFVIEKTIDPGMLQVIENDIMPRLLRDVPNQPSEDELLNNPTLSRFHLIFDREGYSPTFFARLWKNHRIACISYHKHPGDPWLEQEFTTQQVTMPNGERVEMKLAERGSLVGSGKQQVWMKEIRRLTDSGHQTSLISTAYELQADGLAARMFTRWCQENFFRYMMQHFAIDLLSEYGTEAISGTETVVNPVWRSLDRQRNSLQNKLRYRQAKFAQMTLNTIPEEQEKAYQQWVRKKSGLLEEIENLSVQLADIKQALKGTQKHIAFDELEEADQFNRLSSDRKRLMDTIKMLAYRAETAMAQLIKDDVVDMAAARRLMQDLFMTTVDILPDEEKQQLTIKIHGASRPAANRKIQQLVHLLNEADIEYPGTTLKLRYVLSSYELNQQKISPKVKMVPT